MRRRTAALLSALVGLALLLGACSPPSTPSLTAGPTASGTHAPTGAATPATSPSPPTTTPPVTPTPTPTPEPTASPTPKPLATLPKSSLPYIGFGTSGWAVMRMAGHERDRNDPNVRPDATFRIEGGTVAFTYAPSVPPGSPYDPVDIVVGITVVDASGTHVRTVGARADAESAPWSVLTKGTFSVAANPTLSYADLVAACSEPLLDEWSESYLGLAPGVGWRRVVTFPGLWIVLAQAKNAVDKDVWYVLADKTTDATFASPLGWSVGQSAADVIAAASALDWTLVPTVGPDGTLASLSLYFNGRMGGDPCVSLHFTHDRLTSIRCNPDNPFD